MQTIVRVFLISRDAAEVVELLIILMDVSIHKCIHVYVFMYSCMQHVFKSLRIALCVAVCFYRPGTWKYTVNFIDGFV